MEHVLGVVAPDSATLERWYNETQLTYGNRCTANVVPGCSPRDTAGNRFRRCAIAGVFPFALMRNRLISVRTPKPSAAGLSDMVLCGEAGFSDV
jgi:hypothetical protein